MYKCRLYGLYWLATEEWGIVFPLSSLVQPTMQIGYPLSPRNSTYNEIFWRTAKWVKFSG